MSEAYYERCYQLNAAGDRVQLPAAWADIHFNGAIGIGEAAQIFYACGACEQAEILYFQGRDRAGNPYFTVDPHGESGAIYFSDAAYGWNDPVPAYAERETSAVLASFLSGTMIATPAGETAVETLAKGDLVLTADGRAAPVRRIARQSVSILFDGAESAAPVRIEAGALGPNLPARALKLTADQSLLIDGVLVQAGALVNGVSIRRMSRAETGDRYNIWRVETGDRDVILAEGCLADIPAHRPSVPLGDPTHQNLAWEPPRIRSARLLPASIRARIASRRAA